jgi:hypothetical protein
LEDLLDDTLFTITMLSRDPEGDQLDGLSGAFERLSTFHVDGQTLELQLDRVQLARISHRRSSKKPSFMA